MQELPKNCSEVRASLPLFVGRDLETVEIEAVQAHLSECESCRTELRAAESARSALLSLHGSEDSAASLDPFPQGVGSVPEFDLAEPAGEVPGEVEFDLWPGIEGQLRAEGRIRSESAPAFRFLAGGKQRWIAAAAAALLLAWMGGLLGTEKPAKPEVVHNAPGDSNRVPPAVQVTPVGTSLTDLAVQPREAVLEVELSGGLRPIDPSEGMSRKARIFPLDAPVHRPFDVRLRDNPNAAVGYN